MKILTDGPKVYVIGHTAINRPELDRYFKESDQNWVETGGTDQEKMIEVAGRICYGAWGQKQGRSYPDYQKHILEVAHGSVLAHCTFNFLITGISRGLSLELNRHTAGTAGISQRSTRYTDEGTANYILPREIGKSNEAKEIWETALHRADVAYQRIVGILEKELKIEFPDRKLFELRKMARGAARSILPHSLETQGVWSYGIRAIRNIIEQRASQGAEDEICQLANKMLDAVWQYAPSLFSDYTRSEGWDGRTVVSTEWRKV